jgi:hypothetical protein
MARLSLPARTPREASASPKKIKDQASTAMHQKMMHQNFNSTGNSWTH